jgi:hypothetical protein
MRPPPGGTPGQSRSASGLQYLMICRIWFDRANTAADSDKITIADAAATAKVAKSHRFPPSQNQPSDRQEID